MRNRACIIWKSSTCNISKTLICTIKPKIILSNQTKIKFILSKHLILNNTLKICLQNSNKNISVSWWTIKATLDLLTLLILIRLKKCQITLIIRMLTEMTGPKILCILNSYLKIKMPRLWKENCNKFNMKLNTLTKEPFLKSTLIIQ